jgi:hypothetical protein
MKKLQKFAEDSRKALAESRDGTKRSEAPIHGELGERKALKTKLRADVPSLANMPQTLRAFSSVRLTGA